MIEKPNILMLHRINLNNGFRFNKWYYKRKMIIPLTDLYNIIDNLLKKGLKLGTITQALNSREYFHITFDDGFKEHLICAELLKKKYKIKYNHLTFSVNISNSFIGQFSGMDLIYEILESNPQKLFDYLKIDPSVEVKEIKQIYAKLKPYQFFEINCLYKELQEKLSQQFLNIKEVKVLSKIFQIASHGFYHRFLTEHKDCSEIEIKKSKTFLEQIINKDIEIFCYPEGKNDKDIQDFLKKAKFKMALSIKHEENNNFCIGRKII